MNSLHTERHPCRFRRIFSFSSFWQSIFMGMLHFYANIHVNLLFAYTYNNVYFHNLVVSTLGSMLLLLHKKKTTKTVICVHQKIFRLNWCLHSVDGCSNSEWDALFIQWINRIAISNSLQLPIFYKSFISNLKCRHLRGPILRKL